MIPAQSNGARRSGERPSRHLQDVVLVDDDLRGVPAVGGRLRVTLQAVVREDSPLQAELLLPFPAHLALAARVDEATHSDAVADLVLLHERPHPRDAAHDLVAGHHRVPGGMPLVTNVVEIRMADTAELDLDELVAQGQARVDRRRTDGAGLRSRTLRNPFVASAMTRAPGRLPRRRASGCAGRPCRGRHVRGS